MSDKIQVLLRRGIARSKRQLSHDLHNIETIDLVIYTVIIILSVIRFAVLYTYLIMFYVCLLRIGHASQTLSVPCDMTDFMTDSVTHLYFSRGSHGGRPADFHARQLRIEWLMLETRLFSLSPFCWEPNLSDGRESAEPANWLDSLGRVERLPGQ